MLQSIAAGTIVVAILLTPTASCYSSQEATQVAATVNDTAITWESVQNDVKRIVGEQKISDQRLAVLHQTALQTRIKQLVAFEFLKSRKLTAEKSEIRVEIESLKSKLARVEKTLEDQLKESNQTQQDLEFQINWRIAWSRYLKSKLSDEFLKAHYERTPRRFDGTELKVAHLLIKCDPDDSDAVKSAESKANSLLAEIESGKLDWTSATAKHSDAPTKDSNGELGWIKLSGPMPKTFTEAAFQLNKDEISKPVTTPFGVHLIKCLKVETGKLGWRDAKEAVKKDAETELMNAILEKQKPITKISINR